VWSSGAPCGNAVLSVASELRGQPAATNPLASSIFDIGADVCLIADISENENGEWGTQIAMKFIAAASLPATPSWRRYSLSVPYPGLMRVCPAR